ncbi:MULTISPECIES: SprT family zinc-dependent metalloprotease [Prochlorococcus]|uniref:SprT family zinc-dependent metalloprotease n=1 Tax=Prochlorococcus TaxID=1218 RepID=UPI0007B36143|nr:SprT family zinc-dependent metalloprotease [Prochlorococcus marinus]MEC7382223.1 SprT family zinc-dependent metalloprotease [Cyanobacteriota bacterium]KZR68824.1 SprT-like family protein [Prochlorococcus marinus str. MIT 1313]KZR70938.1 SprT-like family protein [Prochlorococcus marinus str. MIT 1318]KZR77111.1 SprT-like family protein [Prochlorococcus marinus str. MIT 1323]MEC9028406.1 SprT family zinc-dependent metalloprotease [Cyanobacteriota bacterium]
MPLVPLLPLFHRFNREYFNGALAIGSQPLLSVRWSDGRLRKTAGFYRRGLRVDGRNSCEIVLSRPLLELLPQTATESTLCHEMIHAWIDLVLQVKESHGPNFHARMAAINAAQNQFQVSVRHQFPVPQTPPRWWAVCPRCGLRSPYQRRVHRAACRQCCDRHYGGSWHASCVFVYEPASPEA